MRISSGPGSRNGVFGGYGGADDDGAGGFKLGDNLCIRRCNTVGMNRRTPAAMETIDVKCFLDGNGNAVQELMRFRSALIQFTGAC